MADNSGALRRARRQDGRIKRQRALEAITVMESTGEPVSFPAVARQAGVSVSLLYANAELAGRIAAARDRQRQAGRARAWQLPARSLVTVQSLRAELANAKDQARRLSEEVTLLRERLGALGPLDQVLPGVVLACLRRPYLQWTRTEANKTVSRIWSDEQLSRYEGWLDNARRARGTLSEPEALSISIVERDERVRPAQPARRSRGSQVRNST